MKLAKCSSVEELQVVSRFESLRRVLLAEPYAAHRDKPLAYWAVPTDRRLPLAFLGRTLDDLLRTPFAELAATPGIGQKKIRSFVKLLSRVANTDPAEVPFDAVAMPENGRGGPATAASGGFDPATVSEVAWAQWRVSVMRHGQGPETLGRLAPSLKNMTRVIWNTTLESYAAMSLEEIRALKTHGEKRVRAILEVFHGVHGLVANMGSPEHLVMRITPKLIDGVESWVGRMLQLPTCPSDEEIFIHFVNPLLKQVRTDATRQIAALAENRLGINGPVTSVRQAARTMGLTRARVYQLLNEINDIMNVRWPMGRHQVYELRDKLEREAPAAEHPPSLEQFRAAIELFYPGSRRGAAGRLERAEEFGGDEIEFAGQLDECPVDGDSERDGNADGNGRRFNGHGNGEEPTLATAGDEA
jgi:hypothetical protein